MKHLSISLFFIIFLSCSREETYEPQPIDNPYYDQAFTYLDSGPVDSAFFYLNLAKDVFLEANDSLNAAYCLTQMAIILTNQGDHFGGQETSLQAVAYLNQRNRAHHHYLGSNYNNLGIASRNLKDYKRSLDFYDLAIKFSDDSLDTRIYLNNKAVTYKEMENYSEAYQIYQQVVEETSKDPREYARVLSNMTILKWLQDPTYNAIPEFLRALRIRKEENDLWGLNASYAHLTDYYYQKRPDSAWYYARKMYEVAKQIESADDQILALRRMIRLGPSDSTKLYFATYQRLSDSVQSARNAAKNQFAVIRYEAEKNKADNLRLQKENAENAYQISRQRILTTVIAIIAILLLAGSVYWHRKRKQRLELEAQNRIKAHQLKTSKKVHDVVANGLYRVMTEIENKPDIDREGILDRLEVMYEKSRDISYDTEVDVPSADPPDFNDKLAGLLTSFASDETKVVIVGNDFDLWETVSLAVKHEIEHILQELMVNMKKHSWASHVAVRFERIGHELHIHYSDNGVGLPKTFTYRNGLTNTGNRIKNLRGLITFDTEVEKGLKIHLSFPVF